MNTDINDEASSSATVLGHVCPVGHRNSVGGLLMRESVD